MLLIPCPHCGPRAQTEFTYDRPLESIVQLAMPPEEAMRTLYARDNPRGVADELWRHTNGCRQWLVIRRDRSTHAIIGVTAP